MAKFLNPKNNEIEDNNNKKMTAEEKKKLGIRIGAMALCVVMLLGCIYVAINAVLQNLAA